jgi:hypothetical protein
MNKRYKKIITTIVLLFSIAPGFLQSQQIRIDATNRRVIFGNAKLVATLDYNGKASIPSLKVNGVETINSRQAVHAFFEAGKTNHSTLHLKKQPLLIQTKNGFKLSEIVYGDQNMMLTETWTFSTNANEIIWDISRTSSNSNILEEHASPVFHFNSISLWEGAYQDYGGLAWFYLFNKPMDTYGVQSKSAKFWNSKTGNGLSISIEAPGQEVAMVYTRTKTDELDYSIIIAKDQIIPRYDSGINRRLFLRDKTDVWAPVSVVRGSTQQQLRLTWFDFDKTYGRGKLEGVNGEQVAGVLNTIARIGVIGKKHFGGNSWHTPYGPICLHEQYIAQMGLGINDESYLSGYKECLDYYRDHAIKPDGRVWSRWAYSNEDMMPGEMNDKGFYEAQWGYLLDSNPDLVTNVSELYHQTGDLEWVRTHKVSCEKALDWIMQRDENNNGLVEMIPSDHKEQKSSDWIDIIWASYENAFVNAKLYYALQHWAVIEKQLGDASRANKYAAFAAKLASAFNRNIAQGGFWDPQKQCYIHWRDKDGSTHGNNMVTPVNFMAISYGICTDSSRMKLILDNIETQMEKEKLFFWPICMYSYAPGEGKDWQFPFPNYENGDLFLSWGSVAVDAYARYKPEIAMKYIRKVLDRYGKDGLAFQRYGRLKQEGLGDDILAGNSLSIIGLYRSIYGINPLPNRFYLDPHITPELEGSIIKYRFRNQLLEIELEKNMYSVYNGSHKIMATHNFGYWSTETQLEYFNKSSEQSSLKAEFSKGVSVDWLINKWDEDQFSWTQRIKQDNSLATGKINFVLSGCQPGQIYIISTNQRKISEKKADDKGRLIFSYKQQLAEIKFLVARK